MRGMYKVRKLLFLLMIVLPFTCSVPMLYALPFGPPNAGETEIGSIDFSTNPLTTKGCMIWGHNCGFDGGSHHYSDVLGAWVLEVNDGIWLNGELEMKTPQNASVTITVVGDHALSYFELDVDGKTLYYLVDEDKGTITIPAKVLNENPNDIYVYVEGDVRRLYCDLGLMSVKVYK